MIRFYDKYGNFFVIFLFYDILWCLFFVLHILCFIFCWQLSLPVQHEHSLHLLLPTTTTQTTDNLSHSVKMLHLIQLYIIFLFFWKMGNKSVLHVHQWYIVVKLLLLFLFAYFVMSTLEQQITSRIFLWFVMCCQVALESNGQAAAQIELELNQVRSLMEGLTTRGTKLSETIQTMKPPPPPDVTSASARGLQFNDN